MHTSEDIHGPFNTKWLRIRRSGHISFSSNEHIRNVFATNVDGQYEEQRLKIDNYWCGYRIPHPVQCNLRGLPSDLVTNVISDFVVATVIPRTSARETVHLQTTRLGYMTLTGKSSLKTFQSSTVKRISPRARIPSRRIGSDQGCIYQRWRRSFVAHSGILPECTM
jgi:hypothetical protein